MTTPASAGTWRIVLSDRIFAELSAAYAAETSFGIAVIEDGEPTWDSCSSYPWSAAEGRRISCARMIEEATRWGEPNIEIDADGRFVWCVPVFLNNLPVAGLFSASRSPDAAGALSASVRTAAWRLLRLAEERNLVNTSLLERNRSAATTNARRAEAIHESKRTVFQKPRDIYLIEERRLLDAVRRRDIEAARESINRVLVGVYNAGRNGFDVLKPLVLEMVVQMLRAAVEEGAEPSELIGTDGSTLLDFLNVENEDALSRRLSAWLEVFVNTPFASPSRTRANPLTAAILFMRANLNRPITRSQAAHAAGLSPAYFSTMMRRGTGTGFSRLLNRFRIEHACSLLAGTDMTASDIAFSCGFNDQGYFTRVFREVMGTTPGKFRGRRDKQIIENVLH